jgi:hypothetical protein
MLLYAVVPADARAPEGRGLSGYRLETIRSVLAAVIVEERHDHLRGSNEESRAFVELICNLATTTPLLPIRFPTVLTTRSAVLAELQAHEAAWRRKLAELHGLSEVVVRAQWEDPDQEVDAASHGSGTSYLLSRAGTLRRRDATVAEISELLRHWTRQIKVLPSHRGIRIACLVANADVPQLKDALLSWQEAHDDRQAVVGGPWPPFSFVVDQEALKA